MSMMAMEGIQLRVEKLLCKLSFSSQWPLIHSWFKGDAQYVFFFIKDLVGESHESKGSNYRTILFDKCEPLKMDHKFIW